VRTETGDQIVDWLMGLASDQALPVSVREEARRKLRDCALRKIEETVEDVVGTKH
jgi:hypothetical protein